MTASVSSTIAIVGTGLIGGSLALALKRTHTELRIVGVERSEALLAAARARGMIDAGTTDPASAAAEADLVVVATDLAAMGSLFEAIAPALAPETVVTDVGSVKGDVIARARAAFGNAFPRFVPGHPIAGTERSGVAAAFSELFDHHRVLLTPLAETDGDAVARVTALWEAAGASVECLDPAVHDRALALTSHLPHVAAYALVEGLNRCVEAPGAEPELARFAAGGFADITRVAKSRPDLWTDIVLRNREAVLAHGRVLQATLGDMLDALEAKDAPRLEALFGRAAATRQALPVRERSPEATAAAQATPDDSKNHS